MKKKKVPGDYPQLAFRISADDKAKISKMALEIKNASNSKIKQGDLLFRKNDILVDALFLGLLTLKKNGRRLVRS